LGYKFIHFEKPFNRNFAQSYQILTQIAKQNAAVASKFRFGSRAFEALFLRPKNRGSNRPFIAAAKPKFHLPFYKILIPFRIECIKIPFIKSFIKTEV